MERKFVPLLVAGARPNFMKVAPILRALSRHAGCAPLLVHTGQHYDRRMSEVFFRDLEMPAPDIFLGVGSGTQAEQTARIMLAFEPRLDEVRPQVVVVVGDVNSTVACALVASKKGVPLVHVEAGLRSGDRTMPEELNRLVTDALSDLLLTPSPDADENLLRENIPPARIQLVGNVMVDSLLAVRGKAQQSSITAQLGLSAGRYALLTLHRPSNVDDPKTLGGLLQAIVVIAERLPVVFPVHPRTRSRMQAGHVACPAGVILTEPLGYVDFVRLIEDAQFVLTDSGGVQEETTVLQVPCLTLRDNTERPITATEGTNRLVGTDPERIVTAATQLLETRGKQGQIPRLWDGKTGERIAEALLARFR